MSFERVNRKSGPVWRVRWRDENGNPRTKTIGKKRDAETFDADIKRRKRMGQLRHVDAGTQSVAAFADEWWKLHVVHLAASTRETYAVTFDTHILPRVGGLALRDVTPGVVAGLAADLQCAGVGPAARRKALAVLHGIFACAVRWEHVQTNPVAGVQKPSGRRDRVVDPPSPETVEAMRSLLLAGGRRRDATVISVLAYAGLRPGEAMALTWGQIKERTILVDRAASDGQVKVTKTGRARAVRLLAPLAADLAEWKLARGRPDDHALVFPTRDMEPWRKHDWRNWTRRTFDPIAGAVGKGKMVPYDLRHGFCSLLLHEGMNVVEVARQAGHAPTMTLDTYAHVMAEVDGAERVSAEVRIRRAREAGVSGKCPPMTERSVG